MDSAETLLLLTQPHEGGRGEQRTRIIFSFFFSLSKHVKTHILTCPYQMIISGAKNLI